MVEKHYGHLASGFSAVERTMGNLSITGPLT
jgi:hypothetical protein